MHLFLACLGWLEILHAVAMPENGYLFSEAYLSMSCSSCPRQP